MIDAWQVRPPRLVTIAAAVFMTGSQSGVVVSATSTCPGLNSLSCVRFSMRFTAPEAIRSPTERPSVRISPLPSSTYVSSAVTLCWEATVSGRACTM